MKAIIVDDVETNLIIFSEMIKNIGDIETETFSDPKEALTWCEENICDLVIVDFMMPELDGITFSTKFREIPHNESIPIIMITALQENSIKMDALSAGINDFLTKPVNQAEFIARVKNMLQLRDAHKKLSDKAKWLAEEVKKATRLIDERESEIILRLSKAAEFRDDDTGDHILRMAQYSYHIAKNLELPEHDQVMILKAAPMHDVGKIAIPDNILLKPGKLTDEEFEIIKTHTVSGFNILADSEIELLKLSAEIAITHHEKFNGRGYPKGLKGEEIPLSGRICAVADVFDALTSKRPYKEPWPIEKAFNLLKQEKGEHFDPKCVDAFFQDIENVLKIKEQYNK